jgi:hypothetical protein
MGPVAFEGPSFDAVTTTVPVAPGAMVGVLTRTLRSAEPLAVTIVVGFTVLFPVEGSLDGLDTEAEPPLTVPAGVLGDSDTGMATLLDEPGVIGPAPVQPAGNEPTVTPAGGL